MHGPLNVKFPNNTSKWQMEFNSAFKGLKQFSCASVGDKNLIISRCAVRLWKFYERCFIHSDIFRETFIRPIGISHS
jgi:hypothetical protein